MRLTSTRTEDGKQICVQCNFVPCLTYALSGLSFCTLQTGHELRGSKRASIWRQSCRKGRRIAMSSVCTAQAGYSCLNESVPGNLFREMRIGQDDECAFQEWKIPGVCYTKFILGPVTPVHCLPSRGAVLARCFLTASHLLWSRKESANFNRSKLDARLKIFCSLPTLDVLNSSPFYE